MTQESPRKVPLSLRIRYPACSHSDSNSRSKFSGFIEIFYLMRVISSERVYLYLLFRFHLGITEYSESDPDRDGMPRIVIVKQFLVNIVGPVSVIVPKNERPI